MNPTPTKTRIRPERGLAKTVQQVDSQSLLNGQKSVTINHGQQKYRLIMTRNGGLVLKK